MQRGSLLGYSALLPSTSCWGQRECQEQCLQGTSLMHPEQEPTAPQTPGSRSHVSQGPTCGCELGLLQARPDV